MKKHKLWIYIIIFLIAGLYIDIKMQDKGYGRCTTSGYRQRALNIQFIIPFHPQRHVLALGVGNKHYEHDKRITRYWEGVRGEEISEDRYEVLPVEPNVLLEEEVYESGCTYSYQQWKAGERRSFYGSPPWTHNIDLRPFSRIREEGQVNVTTNDRVMTKERYEEWYK
jgi:hypothetical protein